MPKNPEDSSSIATGLVDRQDRFRRPCSFFAQPYPRAAPSSMEKGIPNGWISWARRCRIPVFVELAGRIVRHRQAIDAALDYGLSKPIESTNTKIRVLTRVAFSLASTPPKRSSPWPARRPPARTARTRLTPTLPSSANSVRPRCPGQVGGLTRGPLRRLGQQQRAGQACPSALTSQPPHPHKSASATHRDEPIRPAVINNTPERREPQHEDPRMCQEGLEILGI